MTTINVALLQAPFVIGSPLQNAGILDGMINDAIDKGGELILTPECALSGYPAEDILFRQDHQRMIAEALQFLLSKSYPAIIIIGYPDFENDTLTNRATVIDHGQITATYAKRILPNFRVFDEKRYFTPGNKSVEFTIKGKKVGLFICEDLWNKAITDQINKDNMDLIISLNGSPYYVEKQKKRLGILTDLAKEKELPIAYVNCVGGQDAILFDGGSAFINNQGDICELGNDFEQQIILATFDFEKSPSLAANKRLEPKDTNKQLIEAICCGIKQYVTKNHFTNGALIALSGGIDSAVTLSLAVKALGADKVEAVYMPSQFNADISEIDARKQAENLGVKFSVLPIEPVTNSIDHALKPYFSHLAKDVTEENIQARIRGLFIMALSNKYHKLVLTTGNKSEYAVGYATLYGDMCGGYAPIKDLYKTQVYAIAHALNDSGFTIPERVITREPSAELSENQLDSQSLPPYDVLDTILQLFIEEDESIAVIHKKTGYDLAIIERVIKLVLQNEYKRQQSAPGPRVSKRAFGKDRRYPISLDAKDFISQSESLSPQ